MAVRNERAPAAGASDEGYRDGETNEEIRSGQDGQDGEEADGATEPDAEGADEGEDGGEGEEDLDPDLDEPPLRTRTRGEDRFQRLANENRDLRRQLEDRTRRPAGPTQPVAAAQQEETDAQFAARIEMLAPHQQMMETQKRSEQRFTRFMQHQSMVTQDQLDKAQFDAKAAVNPRFKRYANDVENLRAELLQQGQMVPRQVLLEVVLGRRILANDELARSQGGKRGRQRQQAERRVQAQRVAPQQNRSDAGSQRGRLTEREARAKRLEGMQI